MKEFSAEIFQTIAVIALMVVLRLLTRSAVSRALRKFNFSVARRKMTVKTINIIVGALGVLTISAIWGIKQGDLLIFISSVLTVLGIAFFAIWSLLSNVTAGLILFFNHPVQIGNAIKIHDKDFPVEGKVMDIGYFFMHLETRKGERITIPNSLLLQKMVTVTEA